jgi:hypothetical protein
MIEFKSSKGIKSMKHHLASEFFVPLYVCDRFSQLSQRSHLIEILTTVNEWLYHHICLHEKLVAPMFHFMGHIL